MAWLRRTPSPLRAAFDESGITQVIGTSLVRIDWPEVTAIYAYKKDCLIEDQIRLEIVAQDKNILCTEDDQSFEEVAALIRRYLPNSLPDWHMKLVTSPAFQLTLTQVYPTSPHVP